MQCRMYKNEYLFHVGVLIREFGALGGTHLFADILKRKIIFKAVALEYNDRNRLGTQITRNSSNRTKAEQMRAISLL